MAHVVASTVLALILLAAAVLKLASPATSAAALATFGVRGRAAQRAALGAIVVLELGLAAGVGAGVDAFAYAAAGLMAAFALAVAVVLARGRAGAPCACFGARSRVGPGALVRDVVLAAAFAALPLLPDGDVSTEAWLAAGLVVCVLAVAGLAVAVLALAREVGMLRLALGPQQALEVPEEGPEVGSRSALVARLPVDARTRLGLAVFSSEGCHLCTALAPAVASLAHEDDLAVAVFDEVRDADAWRAADVPGSPFAVALDPGDGTVLAKGTFNGLGQLESIVATAQRRALELVHA